MEKDPAAFHYEGHDVHDNEGDIRSGSLDHGHLHEHPTMNQTNPSFHHFSNRNSHHEQNALPTSPTPIDQPQLSTDDLNNRRKDTSITLTPEMFEKLYLSPPNQVSGDLRATFANPTPISLLGFLLTASPLSCDLMGWMGAGGGGAANTGAYYFIGGFLMSLGGILEFFLGNTFSFVVFCSFGGFWFTLGATLTPAFNAYGAYAPDPAHPAAGLQSPGFHASFGMFHCSSTNI